MFWWNAAMLFLLHLSMAALAVRQDWGTENTHTHTHTHPFTGKCINLGLNPKCIIFQVHLIVSRQCLKVIYWMLSLGISGCPSKGNSVREDRRAWAMHAWGNAEKLHCISDSLWSHGLWPARLPCPWDFPGKNIGVGSHFFFQVNFLAQGWNPCLLGLLHCRQILYCWATGEGYREIKDKKKLSAVVPP